jgi:hypothetical protein
VLVYGMALMEKDTGASQLGVSASSFAGVVAWIDG